MASEENKQRNQIAFRVDDKTLEALDRYIAAAQKKVPGLKLTRSNAARALFVNSLNENKKG